jgi:hypothetical protein
MHRCITCGIDKPSEAFVPSAFKMPHPRCRDCDRAKYVRWKERNPARYRAHYTKWNRKAWADPQRRAALKAKANERNKGLRDAAFAALGNSCVCCGECCPMFLQIDHINNDGWTHRKALLSGAANAGTAQYRLYRSILAGQTSGLQLLCANCNWGKARNRGVCPHEAQRQRDAMYIVG